MSKIILKPEAGMHKKVFACLAGRRASNAKKIIIQEEHSQIYKSQQAPRFNLRDVAIQMAKIKKIKLELKSDTPSLESYHKYKLCPKIKKTEKNIIDMRQEKNIISRALVKALKNAKSCVLFINRLGAATFILCRDCGYIAKCENCDVPLVYHIKENQLLCHHCTFKTKAPVTCPQCNSWQIKYLGTGIEKIKQEISKLKFKNKILITTLKQKLPKADLIAVINIDNILNLPDFRAPEKTFQALVKLNNLAKKMLIQTYNPEHYVFDFENFYKQELKIRKTLNYPPFCQLIKLTYRDKSPYKAKISAFKLAKQLTGVLGPAPAFIPKKRNFYYWNIILRDKKQLKKVPNNWVIDVDPIDML